MKSFLSAFKDGEGQDAPYSFKRIGSAFMLILVVPVFTIGCYFATIAQAEWAKWIIAGAVAVDALFIVAVLVLMGYAKDIEIAITAARGNK